MKVMAVTRLWILNFQHSEQKQISSLTCKKDIQYNYKDENLWVKNVQKIRHLCQQAASSKIFLMQLAELFVQLQRTVLYIRSETVGPIHLYGATQVNTQLSQFRH